MSNFYDRVQALKGDPCEATLRSSTYKMSGDVEFLPGGKVSVARQGDKSTYVVLNEKDIHSDTVTNAGDALEFFVDRGSEAELHYGGGKSHQFKIDPSTERNFYLDQEKNEIVFTDDRSCEGEGCSETTVGNFGGNSKCWAWVIVGPWKYSSGCCNSDHGHDGWGLVGCNQEWCVSACCPDIGC